MRQRPEESIELKVGHPVRLPLPGRETWVVSFALKAPPKVMNSISKVEYSLSGGTEKTRILTDLSGPPFLSDLETDEIQGIVVSATVHIKKRWWQRERSVSLRCPIPPPRSD